MCQLPECPDPEDQDDVGLADVMWNRSVLLVRSLQDAGVFDPLLDGYTLGCGGDVACSHGNLRGRAFWQYWQNRRALPLSCLSRDSLLKVVAALVAAWACCFVGEHSCLPKAARIRAT